MNELHGVSFGDYFRKVEASEFLTGKISPNGFRATFNWLMKPENVAKVLSGNYDERFGAATDKAPSPKNYDESLW